MIRFFDAMEKFQNLAWFPIVICHAPEINWLHTNLDFYLGKQKNHTWTILTQTHRENGNVKTIRIAENIKITVEIQLPQYEVSSPSSKFISTVSLCPFRPSSTLFMINLVSLLLSAVSRFDWVSKLSKSSVIQEQQMIHNPFSCLTHWLFYPQMT